MATRLTFLILVGVILGIGAGTLANRTIADPAALATVGTALSILTDLFLRLIKMVIAPLVFGTLVAGIAHMGAEGEAAALGRIGLRTIGWFLGSSLVSLALGLVAVNLLRPGVGLALPLPPASAASGVATTGFDLHDFILHVVPASPVAAMADNEILQIVVFAGFVGVACTAIGRPALPIVHAAEALAQVMIVITGYVMRLAPVAVFAAVANAVARQGLGILATYGGFIAGFYAALAVLWLLLLGAAAAASGGRVRAFWAHVRDPFLLAFTTASSEAAFPRTLDALERFGVPQRIAGFVLPLGYSFNLTGTMMYAAFATVFIAQAYGIPLSAGQQVAMLLLLMVTSKGVAGVPRAALVVIASTLAFFHLPEAGLLLILAIDHFLDMGRSATNVIGNAVAATLVARWEGVLRPAAPEVAA